MSAQLALVIVIDTESALEAGSLEGNTYIVDNNRHYGSQNQATENLITAVEGNQILNWLALSADLVNSQPRVILEDIGGEAVEAGIMVPQQFESPELGEGLGLWWGATVDSQNPGTYAYTLYFDIGGTKMSIDSHVEVRPAFSNVALEGTNRKFTARDYRTPPSPIRHSH